MFYNSAARPMGTMARALKGGPQPKLPTFQKQAKPDIHAPADGSPR